MLDGGKGGDTLVGGLGAVLLRELPLRLGLIAGIALGIGAGFHRATCKGIGRMQ